MDLFELVREDEQHPAYRQLSAASALRQLGFLESIIKVALDYNWHLVSTGLIKALNHQAIACLHAHAGQYRPCEVQVGEYHPPAAFRVPELMNDMVNNINRGWDSRDPLSLAAYVLWRINWIHPFVNGNGRTARALCYYVFRVKLDLHEDPTPQPLPTLIKEHQLEYISALKEADNRYRTRMSNVLEPVRSFIRDILTAANQRP